MELSSRSQKKVDSIVLNASRLFVQHGYHKVTMESIAQYANVSKVTLYKYFADKQVLYEHILKTIYLEEYNEIIEVIDSHVPFEEKIDGVVKARIKKYYDNNKPIFHGEITLSLDLQKFIKKHKKQMIIQRKKLYEQGKMEGFICEDVTDQTLEMYFKIIQKGLVSEFKDLGELESENLSQLLKILYAGVLGCQN
ncbi:HTH-type transcriptional repressor Bm3R1 [Candidatus Izimaplasma bacterium HR1]|jgi:AcrR family transcriptional regulator|uniref:TetR/AcrR family transcriptional regulator n=1 Tax=Candidatus Izimoplasma sp. HR1 TaxID=1541959 RepID=UPI0004F7ED41|nr:HTH-type transcriptional repressor Bm3R1 [Candidatus Izimaplasma bacterium HR1]